MKNKAISIEERKHIQLEMLKEIDAFCRNNDIKYTLAYGTMIGAIRHHGYIPWDDDVDLLIPEPDMIRFKRDFKSETLKFCDVDTEPGYDFHFPRISYRNTYKKTGLISRQYGVCIDFYYMIGLPDSDEAVNRFFEDALKKLAVRKRFMKWSARVRRYLPVYNIPFYKWAMLRYRNHYFHKFPYENSKRYFAVAGLPTWKEVYNYDLFEELIDMQFENLTLKVSAKYHEFLTQEYGDYMQLPPVEERVAYHGSSYYWK